MCFPIVTGIKNGRFSRLKVSDILLNDVPLKLNFQDEGQLHAN